MIQIKQNLVSKSKYNIKCPYSMTPQYVTFHNTDNDAPAKNEISYMISNNNEISFHLAVDDIEAIQGIPFNRNAWHAGDGNGDGNRKSIGVEICYSELGANNAKFKKAEANAVIICAQLLKQFNLSIDRLKPHKHWSGKDCPSVTNHAEFIARVKAELYGSSPNRPSESIKYKNGDYNCNAKVISSDGILSVRESRPVNGNLGNKLGELHTNDIVFVGYCLDGWFGINFNGKQGFINGEYVELVKENEVTDNYKYKNGDYNCKAKIVSSDGVLSVREARPINGELSEKIGNLKSGDIINVGYCLNNWFGIIYNGNQGFICGDYIELIKIELPSISKPWKNGTYQVKAKVTENLNCRKGRPGQSNYSTIIKVIPKGTIITIDYCLNGWFSTYDFGQVGFVSGDYIQLI